MNRAGTDRPIEYAVTRKGGGGYRAECHVCGWWVDVQLYESAVTVLRHHVALHPDVVWSRRREEVRAARP